jgi:hypothetical protein
LHDARLVSRDDAVGTTRGAVARSSNHSAVVGNCDALDPGSDGYLLVSGTFDDSAAADVVVANPPTRDGLTAMHGRAATVRRATSKTTPQSSQPQLTLPTAPSPQSPTLLAAQSSPPVQRGNTRFSRFSVKAKSMKLRGSKGGAVDPPTPRQPLVISGPVAVTMGPSLERCVCVCVCVCAVYLSVVAPLPPYVQCLCHAAFLPAHHCKLSALAFTVLRITTHIRPRW